MIRYGTSARDNFAGTVLDDFLYGYTSIGGPESDAADDTLWGLEGDDYLSGGGGVDLLMGGGDDDTLEGGSGGDTLDGGTGFDTASYFLSPTAVFINLALGTAFGGDAEGDTFRSIENVTGSRFDDVIVGDDGRNVVEGWSGNDRIWGGDGDDDLYGDWGIDRLFGGNGEDRLYGGYSTDHLWGEDGEDILDGGDGDDFLHGGLQDDTFIGSLGVDSNYGGGGIGDLVDYSGSFADVEVNLVTGRGSGGFAEGDSYEGIENVTGSRYGDTITGDGRSNVLRGGGGVDVLSGGDGNDILIGGAGADQLDGGGNTEGGDLISYESSSTGVWVDLAAGSGRGGDAEGDKFARIEHIAGSSHKDTLIGDRGNNRLEGNFGSDDLHGNEGHDILVGGGNDDRLWGDAGADHLWGGTGADTFMYTSVSDSPYSLPGALERFDTIHDFVSAAIGGSDKIDLSAVDADATRAGHQAFNLVYASYVHSTVIGDLSAMYVADGVWNLVGETDGDAAADFLIRVNSDRLSPGDFIM